MFQMIFFQSIESKIKMLYHPRYFAEKNAGEMMRGDGIL